MDNEGAIEPVRLKRETLLWALGLGVLGDLLLRAGPLGPGLTLWIGMAGVGSTWLALRADSTRWLQVAEWSAVALMAAGLMMVRHNGFIQFLLFLMLPLAASQIIMLGWGARLGRSLPLDHLYALVLVPARALFGAVPLLAGAARGRDQSRTQSHMLSIARGLALALPLVWVFTGLLSSADAGFNRFTDRVFDWFTLTELTNHLIVSLLLAWVVSGWLATVVDHDQENQFRRIPLPSIGRVETLIVLGSLVLLFGGFVLLQLGYLFGGQKIIQSVSGLTMAEYARRGFFELVTIAGLTLVVMLFVGALTTSQSLYRKLALVMVSLVLVMLVSATQRFLLYIDVFGLSLDRLTVLTILLWLAFSLVFFATTVLRGRLNWFASGSTIAGMAMVLVFALMNPADWVARVNLDRAIEHQQTLDTDYLVSLGADAVPVVLMRLESLPDIERCQLATKLLWRWPPTVDARSDWRVWNMSEVRAHDRVNKLANTLRAWSRGCPPDR